MALVPDAKKSLWAALRALRNKNLPEVQRNIEEAMIYLELDRRILDPSLKLK